MSFIPPLTTLRAEDFSGEERKWLPRLFRPLNTFLTAASTVINGRIEFGSNIPALDTRLVFTHDGSARRIRWDKFGVPKFMLIGEALEAGTQVPLVSTMVYDPSTSTVSMQFYKLDGFSLTVGTEYKIWIRIIP